jgi:hypothetical protein
MSHLLWNYVEMKYIVSKHDFHDFEEDVTCHVSTSTNLL